MISRPKFCLNHESCQLLFAEVKYVYQPIKVSLEESTIKVLACFTELLHFSSFTESEFHF